MSQITLKNVAKSYGDVSVIHSIDLEIMDGEFIVLVGPSGSGKSTMLRLIAGLESVSDGTITIGQKIVNNVPPKFRNIATFFQNNALYPYETVYQNMALSLRMKKLPEAEVAKKVIKAAEILEITSLLDHKPETLSDTQRQRVIMGRALVRDPEVLLFDEPLFNLDQHLRTRMQIDVKNLHKKINTTTIYVTHDHTEAMTLADRLVIMKDGRIEQIGTPQEIYEKPANIFVAGFIGNPAMNMLKAEITHSEGRYTATSGEFRIRLPDYFNGNIANQKNLIIGIRPNSIAPVNNDAPISENFFDGRITGSQNTGSSSRLELDVCGLDFVAEIEDFRLKESNRKKRFKIDSDQIHLFHPETGASI